jgi:hypothetical protein
MRVIGHLNAQNSGSRSITPRLPSGLAMPTRWERRTVSMVARPATAHAVTADAVEFIRFCYARRRVGWPELYDEMCAVASRGLFRGWGPDDLEPHGIKFGLFEMPHLAMTVSEVVAEDRAKAKAAVAPVLPSRTPAVA